MATYPLDFNANLAGITSVIEALVNRLRNVNVVSANRIKFIMNLAIVRCLIANLQAHIQRDVVSASWMDSVMGLALEGGPLHQFSDALRLAELSVNRTSAGSMLNMNGPDDFENLSSKTDRVKAFLLLASQDDTGSVA